MYERSYAKKNVGASGKNVGASGNMYERSYICMNVHTKPSTQTAPDGCFSALLRCSCVIHVCHRRLKRLGRLWLLFAFRCFGPLSEGFEPAHMCSRV